MSELELLLICCKKALEKSEGGVKAKSGDKMSYKKALKVLSRLDTYFRVKGAFSFGICLDCDSFDQRGHQSVGNSGGTCTTKKCHTTVYDTCDRHSSKDWS